jgi:hypothetical protein
MNRHRRPGAYDHSYHAKADKLSSNATRPLCLDQIRQSQETNHTLASPLLVDFCMNTKFLVSLRVLVFLAGAICVGYGCLVGAVGIWVDGPVIGPPRKLGLLVLAIGLFYWFPVWVLKRRAHIAVYGLIVALPFLTVLVLLCRDIGNAQIRDLAVNAAFLIPGTGAPLLATFLTYLKQNNAAKA